MKVRGSLVIDQIVDSILKHAASRWLHVLAQVVDTHKTLILSSSAMIYPMVTNVF